MPLDLNVVTFIFFALAVVIFIQLRNVLGRRTGHERPPFDPFAAPAAAETKKESAPAESGAPAAEQAEPFAAIDAYAPAGSRLNTELRALSRADSAFAPQEFLAGARAAYEMILTAFAKGDRAALKPLLTEAVYADFAAALDARAAAGERVEFSFVGVEKAEIAEAKLTGRQAEVAVLFRGQIISATYDKAGELAEGDMREIVTLRDKWSFTRNVEAESPDWQLAATADEE